jgi:hypothetical protein
MLGSLPSPTRKFSHLVQAIISSQSNILHIFATWVLLADEFLQTTVSCEGSKVPASVLMIDYTQLRSFEQVTMFSFSDHSSLH